jgi:hypothetical protein
LTEEELSLSLRRKRYISAKTPEKLKAKEKWMSSIVLLIPIAAVAFYSVYRHLKKEIGNGGGGGTCCDCPSKGKCGVNTAKKGTHC